MAYFEILSSFGLTKVKWISIYLAAFVLGMSKSGIKGIGILIVIALAFVFGEKTSTGILLPMLIAADILAVLYYNRHTQWKYIKKLLPWMVTGVLIGVWVGNDISEALFKKLMAIIIFFSVILMFYLEKRKTIKTPSSSIFSVSTGLLAGFSTMMGNLAGPVSNIYFLAMRLPKNEFIGTGAWLFFIINLFKLPFHIIVWKTVSADTLVLNSALLPAVIAGFFTGTHIVKIISNRNYRNFVMAVTALAAVLLLIR